MESLNIPEWTPDQVAEWMSGLGPKVAQYIPELHKKGLNGAKLLTLRCDDLEYLGINIIGHQELLLEAVEHLRNFHYEISRECVQQLALRVSSAAWSLARALRHHADARLETHSLADVARTVHAVKPLVCWLDRWPLGSRSPLAERKAALLKLSLEAATCAQRDRFAEQPARAVAAAAAALAALADHLIQDVADPMILQPASLDAVALRQGERALGFEVVPSFCGHHQLAHIRFASPAHASGRVHEADEIVAVGGACVLGWRGDAVERACAAAARGGELALRLRRRGAPPPAALPPEPRAPRPRARARALPPLHAHLRLRYELEWAGAGAARAASSSDESEALSPPASPASPARRAPAARLYAAAPALAAARRHSVCGGSPPARRPPLAIDHFWQQLQQRRWHDAPGDALYRRDKAVSCSTGLQLSPRPRTCLGVPRPPAPAPAAPPALAPPASAPAPAPAPAPAARGRLDKSHSTPAYAPEPAPAALAAQPIPESPTTEAPRPQEKAGQILDFKKSSSQIEEAIQLRSRRPHDDDRSDIFTDDDIKLIDDDKLEIVETVNTVLGERVKAVKIEREDSLKAKGSDTSSDDIPIPVKYPKPRITERYKPAETPPSPPPRPAPAAPRPRPRAADMRDLSPLKPVRPGDATQISVPLRHITKHDIKLISTERRELPPINGEPEPPAGAAPPAPGGGAPPAPGGGAPSVAAGADSDGADSPKAGALSPTGSVVRGFFPSSKSRSLKKKNSILAKRREVPARALAARGAGGRAWQRVRAGGGAGGAGGARWAARHLVLAAGALYAYRGADSARAACWVRLAGFTAAAAGEVHSRAHAFKVYHTGVCFYFAAASRDAMLAWLALLQRAALLPAHSAPGDLSKQYSETDYSETESDSECSERRSEREREREREREKEKEKSKFGSLKKLTHRAGRSESQENVNQPAATSLDRKYLRIFSRTKPKEDKDKSGKKASPGAGGRRRAPPPQPINYIHASNPNLLDFEKSDFVTKPAIQVPKPKVHKADNLVGFVTLEEFMLKKQEEERQQLYSNRVLLGVERGRGLQQRLARVAPDAPAPAPGRDGYEKIVYPEECQRRSQVQLGPPPAPAPAPAPAVTPHDGWSAGGGAGGPGGAGAPGGAGGPGGAGSPGGAGVPGVAGGAGGTSVSLLRQMFGGARRDLQRQESQRSEQYAHLQCPPTFQPETYSLRPPRRD